MGDGSESVENYEDEELKMAMDERSWERITRRRSVAMLTSLADESTIAVSEDWSCNVRLAKGASEERCCVAFYSVVTKKVKGELCWTIVETTYPRKKRGEEKGLDSHNMMSR